MSSGVIQMVLGPRGIVYGEGEQQPLASAAPFALAVEAARSIAGKRRAVLWVWHGEGHAPTFTIRPGRPGTLVEIRPRTIGGYPLPDDAWSSPGWARIDERLHVSIPSWSGDFDGARSPVELLAALDLFAELLGTDYLYSAPATALFLVDDRRLRPPSRPSGVPFEPSLFSVPAYTWHREPDGAPYAQLFDRRGSYLAAWRSVELPDGEWLEGDAARSGMAMRAGGAWPAGYYLVDTRSLEPFLRAQELPDPFARVGHQAGPTWLTSPLAQLADEISRDCGAPAPVERVVIGSATIRPLDRAAERIGEARKRLEAEGGPLAALILPVLGDAYKRGTAHLEYGRKPGHPLYRPEWRHTIIDRHVANTYRSLRAASVRPVLVGGIDSAVFELEGPADWPHGLRGPGPELGTWRRRGVIVDGPTLRARLEAGKPYELLRDLLGEAR